MIRNATKTEAKTMELGFKYLGEIDGIKSEKVFVRESEEETILWATIRQHGRKSSSVSIWANNPLKKGNKRPFATYPQREWLRRGDKHLEAALGAKMTMEMFQ